MSRSVLIALLVSGCVDVTHTQIGPERYEVQASGTNASESEANDSVNERARALCPNGYSLIDAESSDGIRRIGPGRGQMHSHASITIECTPAAARCGGAPGACATATSNR